MFIESNLYAQIVKSLPIVCVDLIIKISDNNHYLLVQRREEPLKGLKWPPGGRKRLNESILEASQRIAYTELGASLSPIVFDQNPIGLYHDVFECSSFGKHRYETFSLLMQGWISQADVALIKTDQTSERIIIDNSIPERMLNNTYFFIKESI
jgi:hypothetical protein